MFGSMTAKKPNPIPPEVSGSRGGKARRRRLSKAERKAQAQVASITRWSRTPKQERSEAARKAVQARWAKATATARGNKGPAEKDSRGE